MKKIVVGFLLLTSFCFGQKEGRNESKKFSSTELKSDFELLVSTLKEVHPGVYHFVSEDSLDFLAQKYLSQLSNPLTEEEFHLIVRRFVRIIGCGHSTARPSADWYEARREHPYLIPLSIYIADNQMYVKDAFDQEDTIQSGWKILSIDSLSAPIILEQLTDLHERDGFNETFEIRKIEKSFQTYYLFLTGVKTEFNVAFETLEKDTVHLLLQKALARRDTEESSFEYNEKVVSKSNQFGILKKDPQVAVLDLNSFDSRGYQKFYKKGFKLLQKENVGNLVIDLRGNGGGYFPNGNQLLRYLLPDGFTTDFWTKKRKIKRTSYLSMDLGSRVTRKLFNLMPDKNPDDPNRNYEIRYQKKKKDHFNGNIFVFTDGGTFSMGSYVASKLKNSGGVIILGEETGGGETGFNAVLSWKLELPATKIRISIPNYHIDLNASPELNGRGVMPTIPLRYSIEDKINHRDLEMEYLFEHFLSK